MILSKRDTECLRELEKKIGYWFKKRILLRRALTHKSYANERQWPATEHNERYEFLGDAVLDLAISSLLMSAYESHPEGELSKLRAAVVNEAQLAGIAEQLGLGHCIFLGKGEEQTGGRHKASLLSDALEAVFGAIFLDRGYKKVVAVIERLFGPIITQSDVQGFSHDYKTRLQEISQGRFKLIPKYQLAAESGPDHQKTFAVDLYIGEDHYGSGEGKNKKAAEQAAAKAALAKLGINRGS